MDELVHGSLVPQQPFPQSDAAKRTRHTCQQDLLIPSSSCHKPELTETSKGNGTFPSGILPKHHYHL